MKKLKVAWIRDENVPAGQSAMGRLNCECGQVPESRFAFGPDIICGCGRRYSWDGWRKGRSTEGSTLTAYKVILSDGSFYCTSMAAEVTLSRATEYFVGREIDGRLCTDVSNLARR